MNLGQLQTAVQHQGYGTDLTTQTTYGINATYREICGLERWPFLEAQDSSLITVAGVQAYTLPMANWRQLDAVRIAIPASQNYQNLQYAEPQDFRDYQHVDRDTSVPSLWTWMNGCLQFYPVPDDVYTVTIDYIIGAADLSAATDVPLIPVPYHDVLVWGAIEYLGYRERDWLGRNFAEQKKVGMVKQMQSEYLLRQRQSASHVKQSGAWSSQLPYPFTNEGF